MKDRIIDIFKKNNEYISEEDFICLSYKVRDILDECLKGSKLIPYIDTLINIDREVFKDSDTISIDYGGTYIRICLVKDGKIINYKSHLLNKAKKSKDEFYNEILDLVSEYVSYSSNISWCFSYCFSPLSNYGGSIISWSKEFSIPDAIGLDLAKELKKYLKKRFEKDFEVRMFNDASASLINNSFEKDRAMISFIYGTGLNMSFVNDKGNIINTEISNIDCFSLGKWSKEVLDESINKDTNILEKFVSSAYIPSLVSKAYFDIYQENLDLSLVNMEYLNSDKVSIEVKDIYDLFIDRAIKVLAILTYGLILHLRKNDVLIIPEGSPVHKIKGFLESYKGCLDKIISLDNRFDIKYEIVGDKEYNNMYAGYNLFRL